MKSARSLFFSCVLALALVNQSEASFGAQVRATETPTLPVSPSPPPATPLPATTATSPTATPATTTTTPTTTATSNTAQTPSNTSTTNNSHSTNAAQVSSAAPVPSAVVTTDSSGDAVTTVITITPSDTSSSTSSAPSGSSSAKKDSGSLGTGTVVGLSVAGGLAVLVVIGFFIWKFTRKRFTDFDDNEAIKWPELNAHGSNSDSHPLPVHNTGRSGFDTGSELDISRPPSNVGNYSTTSLATDPYAVPPLPHLDPNQPYHDDPGTYADDAAYYDPYHGPVPNTFNDRTAPPEWNAGGEAIPMTQMAGGAAVAGAGRRSPGPQAAIDAYGGPQYDVGAGRRSPGPQAAYGGRTSPGPQAAYDMHRMP